MPKNKAISQVSLNTVDLLAEEVLMEGAQNYAGWLRRVRKAEPGTERHRELLCELSVAANVLAVKAQEAESVIEEYLESLPDDDDD